MNRLIRCGFSIMLALGALGSAGAGAAAADEINVGQSRDEVIAVLGEPQGSGIMGDKEMLFYPRGSIGLMNGLVVESSIVSQDVLDRREPQSKQRQVEQQERNEERVQQRIAQGTREKARMLKDETFATLPAKQQAQSWRQFSRTYPEVAATRELREAEARAREEDLAAREATLTAATEEAPPTTVNRRNRKKWMRGQGRRNERLAEELGLPAPDRPSQDLGFSGSRIRPAEDLGFAPSQETRVKDLGFTPPADRALDNLGFAASPERTDQDLGLRRLNE